MSININDLQTGAIESEADIRYEAALLFDIADRADFDKNDAMAFLMGRSRGVVTDDAVIRAVELAWKTAEEDDGKSDIMELAAKLRKGVPYYG